MVLLSFGESAILEGLDQGLSAVAQTVCDDLGDALHHFEARFGIFLEQFEEGLGGCDEQFRVFITFGTGGVMIWRNDARPAKTLIRRGYERNGQAFGSRSQLDAQGYTAIKQEVQFVRFFAFTKDELALFHFDFI